MTEQKAIELLRFAFPQEITKPITEEVISMAVAALEKQMPKKPLNITKYENGVAKRYENCSIVKCANCNGRLKMKSRGNYCDKCGQKIDWKEVEE